MTEHVYDGLVSETCENCELPIAWIHRNSRDRGRWVHRGSDKEECAMVLYAHPKDDSQTD